MEVITVKVTLEIDKDDAERIATYLMQMSRRYHYDSRKTPLSILRMVEPTIAREAQRLSDLVKEQLR